MAGSFRRAGRAAKEVSMKSTTWIGMGASVLGCAVLCGACGSDKEDDSQLASDGTESVAAAQQSTHLTHGVFAGLGAAAMTDPKAAADDGAASPYVWPAGCVTKAKDASNPALVHVTFASCTGPFGLVKITGGVDVTFSLGTDGFCTRTWWV
jgi:hypothetical protein